MKYLPRNTGYIKHKRFSKHLTLLAMTKRKDGETMTERELIIQADKIRRDKGMSQAEWSRQAGLDDFGKTVSRNFFNGNCKLSTMVKLLRPLGYEIQIVEKEDLP